MTRKDYIKAAKIVYDKRVHARDTTFPVSGGKQRLYEENVATELEESFIEFFRADNPRFDEKRFSEACQPPMESLV